LGKVAGFFIRIPLGENERVPSTILDGGLRVANASFDFLPLVAWVVQWVVVISLPLPPP